MSTFYLMGLLAAWCIGMSKAGFSGVSLVAVVVLAEMYGATASVGLALPLLIAADLMAWPAFAKHGSWQPVWRLLGPTLIGLGVGYWLLDWLHDAEVRRVIGGCVLAMLVLQLARRLWPDFIDRCVQSRGFAMATGITGGFATMLANAAGPLIQLYLMARKIPKMELLGIGARFFLLVNLLKVPLNAKLLQLTPDSLWEDVRLLPGVVVGLAGGRWLIRHVPQAAFEWMVVGFAALAALRLLLW